MASTTRQLDPALVSVATAHGITPRVAATWYPALVRDPRVHVPIELDVLMVRDPTLAWAATGMSTPPQGDHESGAPAVAAASLMPAPFAEKPGARPRGAYLHWYLPNGLTGGTAGGPHDQATFPPIPDRWLVLRMSPGGQATRRAVRGWVLEAGGEPATVSSLDGWTERAQAPDVESPLTALGHGDLSWAGYFDNVENRLGFYDGSLDGDQVRGPLAYLVCGWYADPTADPLGAQTITSLAGFNEAMERLDWTLEAGQLDEITRHTRDYVLAARSLGLDSTIDERIAATDATPSSDATAAYTTNGSWWPTACVLHGAVVGIDWPGSEDAQEVGGPPEQASISVAVGNTMAETIGALVAQANGEPEQAAIVEALQLGVVKELDQPDGRAQLDVQLHASSFASQPGGTPATEPVAIAPSGPLPAPPADPPAPKPGIFAEQQAGGPPAGALTRPELITHAHIDELVELSSADHVAPTVRVEDAIEHVQLGELISKLGAGAKIPASDPGGTVDALRAAPRLFTPKDPVVLIAGGKRAFVHDSSVPSDDGRVVCRLTPVSELSWQTSDGATRACTRGADVLERGVENGSVPIECEGLLEETALLDTGSAAVIAASVSAVPDAQAERNITVEQTAWYSLRNPRVDHGPLIAHSGISGTLPAAYALAPASHPWTPMHLDWSVEFVPSPGGVEDWKLDQVDYVFDGDAVPAPGSGEIFSGRSPVTGGASSVLAAAISNALDQAARIGGTAPVPVPTPGAPTSEAFFSLQAKALVAQFQALRIIQPAASPTAPAQLEDIATALAHMDVLSCGLNGLLTDLRGGAPAGGAPPAGDASTAPAAAPPSPFYAMRAGFLRLVRLRLVDGFGQFVDLCGSDETHAAQGYLVSGPLEVAGQPGVVGLPPRFTAPTRALLRFMSADTPAQEADYQTSPTCAFLLPNHLDGSLEFFNADGSGAGSLQPARDGSVEWQGAPGLPSGAGADPRQALSNRYAAELAQGVIDWGIADATQDRESALSGLLRTIDSTLWSVDPFAHAGDEHLALLLGHPICVIRALVHLEVIDPIASPDGTLTAVPIRLGDLTQWQDGLLGYFVDDDYTKLYVADAAAPEMARELGPGRGFLQPINLVENFYETFANDLAAGASAGETPVAHPFVDTSGELLIRPNQTINLTLLVEPLTSVHATLGLVPRKEIGMRRSWVQSGLAAIAPTFRFGPVLVDPQHIRMPLATDVQGTWVWDYRSDAAAWKEEQVTNATDNALLGSDPPQPIEGWLKLTPPAPPEGGKAAS
ncbi:MAG: hypothetical protein ABSB69_04220 [Solirubrobacteraceae bacterium]